MDVDAAREALAVCQNRVHAASAAQQRAEAVIVAEMTAASSLSGDDLNVEAFAAWLPVGRRAVEDAQAVLERAQQEMAQAFARLNLARVAAEAVEKLIEKQAEATAKEALRIEQIQLDEIGQRRKTE